MEFHLAMREKRNREKGLAPDDARNAALRAFGNPTLLRERGATHGAGLSRRFAARLAVLRCADYSAIRPMHALAAGTLALAIGACTAVFSLAWSLSWPASVRRCHRLTLIHEERENAGFARSRHLTRELSAPAERIHQLSEMSLFHRNGATTHREGEAERIDGANVSANFFDVLGIKAVTDACFARATQTWC